MQSIRRLSPRNLSLRYVVLLALLVGLVAPSWIALEFERTEVQSRLTQELTTSRDRYADLLSVSLREAVWQLAPMFAEPLIDKILEDPNVSFIEVRRQPEGQLFLQRGTPMLSPIAPAMREMSLKGKVLATVSVQVNDRGIVAATQAAQLRFFWRTVAIAGAAALLIFAVLHWRLTRPIDDLVRQSKALAQGRLNEALHWKRDDEVGRVGRSLEDTRVALFKLVGELQEVNISLLLENEQRKTAENKLARYADELEVRVTERTETLTTALTDLRQTQSDLIESKKLASLGRMVAGLSHELNTPIGNALTIGSSIGERIRQLQKDCASGTLKKSSLADFLHDSSEASDVLERSLGRAAALINSFKKIAERDSTENLSTFDLAELISRTCDSFSGSNQGAPIEVVIQIPTGIFLTTYSDLLGQVLLSLLSNAQLHGFDNEPGGRVMLNATLVRHQVELTVSDNGTGVPDDVQQRIFEPLFTTRMGRGGIGMGLSVTQNIVMRNLGGKIHVRNSVPRGACFVITLPMVAPGSMADNGLDRSPG